MYEGIERFSREIQEGLEKDRETFSAAVGGEVEAITQDEWPEIIPFDTSTETEEFYLPALPKPVADYCTAVCEALQVKTGMAGPLALGCLSTLFQGRYMIEAKKGWTEPLNLFLIVSARPSERKTPVFNALMKPFIEYERETSVENRPLIEKNKSERRILEERLHNAEKAASKHGEESENSRLEAMSIAEQLTDFPILYEKRLFTDDSTEEALTRLMYEQGGTITLASDEGGFLSNIKGRYKGSPDLDAILKSYPGTPITIDRIGRNPIRIDKPRLTVMLCCQPSVLQAFLSNNVFSGCGMTARFLYSQPSSIVGKRKVNTFPIPEIIMQNYHDFIRKHLEDDTSGVITLSRDAKELFDVSLEEIEKSFHEDIEDSVEAWRGKYNGNLLRICGLLHAAMSADPINEPVPAVTMLAAGSIADYFYKQFDALSQSVGMNQDEKGARYILEKIKNRASITRSELSSVCRSRKLFPKASDMEPALALLVERGYIRRKTIDAGYKNKVQTIYEINPACT